jgi:hypothetical protein
MTHEVSDNVVHIPIGVIATIASEAGGCVTLLDLASKWSIIVSASNSLHVECFDTQEECASRVADLHMDKEQKVLYVLKDGVPRKNIKIEVKARFR